MTDPIQGILLIVQILALVLAGIGCLIAMVEGDAKSSREWACVGLFLVALVGYNTIQHVLMLRALI